MNQSKGMAFCCGIHIGSQNPLFRCFWLIQKSKDYLVKFQLEPRPKLNQFNLFMGHFFISVMPETDHILFIGEGYDPFGVWLGYGKDMLEGSLDPLSQAALEVMEDQMRIYLGHVGYLLIDIMTEYHVLQSEIQGWTNRQMADDQSIWLSSMFMQQDHICHSFPQAEFNQFSEDCSSSINSLGIRYHDRYLFGELEQSVGRIA